MRPHNTEAALAAAKEKKMEVLSQGGVTAAKGFKAASTAAGIKYQGRTDMAMVWSDEPCT